MNIQMQVEIGLLYFVKKMKLFIFGVEYIPNEIKEFIEELPGNKNIYKKKKINKKIKTFLEYEKTIQ